MYFSLLLRSFYACRSCPRAAPVVAASRTENLRLALSPASKACVWTPRHRRVSWTLTPLLRDSVDIAVECVHPIQGR